MTERGISQAESWAVLAFCLLASSVAIVWSWQHGAMLNYGDAVAHLHIARRVFDSRTPRFTQLGSVWLPLPHLLLVPFVQNYAWWANGLAGVIPSSLAYLASCMGIHRLARRWMSGSAAALAVGFFALNPNLLYLQTTAMTEPLFLCEVVWVVVWMVEWRVALTEETEESSFRILSAPPAGENLPRRPLAPVGRKPLRIFEAGMRSRGAWLRNPALPPSEQTRTFASRSSRLMACVALALIAAVYTRYDGWIMALIAWTGMGLALRKYRQLNSAAFWTLSVLIVAAPLLWFLYNAVGFGDWLYFARGPFSAKAIEMRTAAPGWPPHPGWHDPWVALLYFVKVAELDSAALTWGNALLAIAGVGTLAAWLMQNPGIHSTQSRRIFGWVLLLWLPVPFYTYSVAYGSVPIFFPAWWPYTLYNTRYGLELLPALALGVGFAVQAVADLLRRMRLPQFLGLAHLQQLLPGVATMLLFVLAGANLYAMFGREPVVYEESTKNLEARLPYDDTIPSAIKDLLALVPGAPVLMDTSTYPEIVALTGIELKQTINESDLDIFRAALQSPADHAAVIVAFNGDDVDKAVRAHPQGLELTATFSAKGQPEANVFIATRWVDQSPLMTTPAQPGSEAPQGPQNPEDEESPAPQKDIPPAPPQP